jgi:hypothetical protein
MLGSDPCRRHELGRRQAPQADQVFDRHLVGRDQIGPRPSQLDPPFKMFGAIVGALQAILGHVGQHQIDDMPIVFVPFVHDSRERRSPAVRYMAMMIAGPVQQISDCVFAGRPMRVPLIGKKIGRAASQLAQRLDDIDRLLGKRDEMVSRIVVLVLQPKLHARRRHLPNWCLRIQIVQLCPRRRDQGAWPQRGEREQPQGLFGDW